MTNFDKAAELILPYIGGCTECDRIGDACLDCTREAKDAVKDIAEAGLLAPDVQVIRTLEDIEALDTDTALIAPDYWMRLAGFMQDNPPLTNTYLPAAVLATGTQVRAACEALEQIND